MASRATKKLERMKAISQEPIRKEIAAITRQLPHLRGWSYLPERLAMLKAQLTKKGTRRDA